MATIDASVYKARFASERAQLANIASTILTAAYKTRQNSTTLVPNYLFPSGSRPRFQDPAASALFASASYRLAQLGYSGSTVPAAEQIRRAVLRRVSSSGWLEGCVRLSRSPTLTRSTGRPDEPSTATRARTAFARRQLVRRPHGSSEARLARSEDEGAHQPSAASSWAAPAAQDEQSVTRRSRTLIDDPVSLVADSCTHPITWAIVLERARSSLALRVARLPCSAFPFSCPCVSLSSPRVSSRPCLMLLPI